MVVGGHLSSFTGSFCLPHSRSTSSDIHRPFGTSLSGVCRSSTRRRFTSGSGFAVGRSRDVLRRNDRRSRLAAALRSRLSCRCLSRLSTSSRVIGTPLHDRSACISVAWVGRPGPLRVFSRFRHFARRFWNQIYNHS